MTKHKPSVAGFSPLQAYQATAEYALDCYKQGHMSENDAYYALDEALAQLSSTLRVAFMVRLRNLEALRRPRGTAGAPNGGE